MSLNYAYKYAIIDPETNQCIGTQSGTEEIIHPEVIPIPVYDENYVDKYYLNGEWYVDAEGTIPWHSPLLD